MQLIKKIIPVLKIGLICVLVAGNFLSVAQQIPQVRQLVDTDGPFFIKWETAFEPVKENLPFTRGVIGYAADWDIPGSNYDPANSEAEHILSQFTLAPIIVARDTNREWILVNMSPEEFEQWFPLQDGEFEVKKFKMNLYLLHRIK
ncbi:MAG: hypothetical protein JW963_08570 [Anaerolineales bacterium]|nr:hypothetical protein [Anaerolineales bacterium]